jgi:hypothetical protein
VPPVATAGCSKIEAPIAVQEAADALSSVDCTYDKTEEDMTDEQKQEKCEEVLTELQEALSGISCS